MVELILPHRVDDGKIDSFEGLRIIPEELLQHGLKKSIEFMLDLYRSPSGESLFRSKILAVGYEMVGKTSLLDCLFPLSGLFLSKEGGLMNSKKPFYFILQGRFLRKYPDRESSSGSPPIETIALNNREWNVEEVNKEEKGLFGIKLAPLSKRASSKPLEMQTEDKEQRDEWFARLKRVCLNSATHGIDIKEVTVAHQLLQQSLPPGSQLQLSIWDFAGQHDYYHNHHFFLSSRSLYLVLWRMDQGPEGIRSLHFWLKALACYLPPSESSQTFSVFVVGTHLDLVGGDKEAREERRNQAMEAVGMAGIPEETVEYEEVSCYSLENIEELRTRMVGAVVGHRYMGERLPKSYRYVQEAVGALRAVHRDNPVVEVDRIVLHCRPHLPFEPETVQRALSLLSLWGECCYLPDPPELASKVVLDPRFLTRHVLAQLFNPEMVSYYKNGVVHHADLVHVWAAFRDTPDFDRFAATLINLMRKFEVCFPLEEDLGKPFSEQRSIIPALLPEKHQARTQDPLEQKKISMMRKLWPRDPPFDKSIQLERILQFNIVPSELVSRLLVRLHSFIQKDLVWRNDVVILKPKENTQAWIQVEVQNNRFITTLRGSKRASCCQLMTFIVEEVREVLRRHPNIICNEAVRSPHEPSVSIDLLDVLEDRERNEEERELICPETKLPIKAENLLMMAGILERDPTFGGFPFFSSSSFSYPSSSFY